MKEKFIKPIIEVIELSDEDLIITTSGNNYMDEYSLNGFTVLQDYGDLFKI